MPTVLEARSRLGRRFSRRPSPWELYQATFVVAAERGVLPPSLEIFGTVLGVESVISLRIDDTFVDSNGGVGRLYHEVVADDRAIASDDLLRAERRLHDLGLVLDYLKAVIDSLPRKLQIVLLGRIRFDGSDVVSQRQIGEQFGVSESRVCQLLPKAGRLLESRTGFTIRDVQIMIRMREELLSILVPRT